MEWYKTGVGWRMGSEGTSTVCADVLLVLDWHTQVTPENAERKTVYKCESSLHPTFIYSSMVDTLVVYSSCVYLSPSWDIWWVVCGLCCVNVLVVSVCESTLCPPGTVNRHYYCVCMCLCVCVFVCLFVCVCVLSLIHIWRCRRAVTCRSRWSPYQ